MVGLTGYDPAFSSLKDWRTSPVIRHPDWWTQPVSNRQPIHCQRIALPIVL